MKKISLKHLSVFFISGGILAYELVVMRTFSVGSWSNFGSMVISIALLGFGLAGTFLTFVHNRIKAAPAKWLSLFGLILPGAMAFAHLAAQKIPFNPMMIASDNVQFWWIGLYYIVYAIPFVCGALFIGVAFIALSKEVHKLYFWNMAGSGAGGFFILFCMYIFPPDILTIPALFMTAGGGFLCFMAWSEKKRIIPGVLVFVVSLLLIIGFGKIQVSEFKSISYLRKYPEFKLEHYSYSPLGETHLFSSPYFHFAPGLSDTAGYELKGTLSNGFKGLYIDGGGPIGIMKKPAPREQAFLDYLPMSAPYSVLKNPDVLMIKIGGGTGLFTALYHNALSVDAVEPNPEIVKLFKEVPSVRDFSGNFPEDPRVNLIYGEPRAFCKTTKKKYDLVEISLIDTVGLAQTGGYPVVENYTYTSEGITDYMKTLKSGGMLSVTVWNKLSPPRNVLRLQSSIIDSLEKQGVEDPASRVFSFQLLLQTTTILVKNSPFLPGEIEALKRFCEHMAFEVCYYPGIPERKVDFDHLLLEYASLYFGESDSSGGGEENKFSAEEEESLFAMLTASAEMDEDTTDLLPGDLYHFSLKWMLEGKKKEFFDKYIFDVRPSTDNRPYYTAYLKPGTIPAFLSRLDSISEEWGYILLMGTLFQSLIFALLIILIPIIGKRKDFLKKTGQMKSGGTFGVIIYYACLGLGYMLIEIFLIQKLVFFLENPIFSLSIVITVMLILSGIGSLFSHRFSNRKAYIVRLAVLVIGLTLIFYMTALSPLLSVSMGFPLVVKIFLAVLCITPAAFFMGIPFPGGLSSLSKHRPELLPWAWGINGALSVTGSVLAKLLSVSFGFYPVILSALGLYILAGLLYRSNEGGAGI